MMPRANVLLPWRLAAAAWLAGSPASWSEASEPGTRHRGEVLVGGIRRSFELYEPFRADTSTQRPLILVLHSHGGTAKEARVLSGMNDLADREGFFVVYPEGTSWANIPWRSWNAGNCCGYGEARRIDDVAFIRILLDQLIAAWPIDPGRVYVTGMSNGGSMAYRLACELSDRITAVAPVAGAMGVGECAPDRAVSVLAIHGTRDGYVPYEGGRSPFTHDTRSDPPVRQSVSFWTAHDGCEGEPSVTVDGPVELWLQRGCQDGAEVGLYTITGGRHRWPGARRRWHQSAGPSDRLPASEVIWGFFSRHARRSQ